MPDFDTVISYCMSTFLMLTGIAFVVISPFAVKDYPSKRWTKRQCMVGYILVGTGTIGMGVWVFILTLHGQTHVFMKSYP